MKPIVQRLSTVALALTLAACSTTGDGEARSASAKTKPAASAEAPYPSTYKPYPGRPTALVGATVFDGAGQRIDNGTVLFANTASRPLTAAAGPVVVASNRLGFNDASATKRLRDLVGGNPGPAVAGEFALSAPDGPADRVDVFLR